MITQAQIDTCRELASLMKEKGVKWEPQDGDLYIDRNGDLFCWFGKPTVLRFIERAYPDSVPYPTFSRCVEVLREWGWEFKCLSEKFLNPDLLNLEFKNKDWQFINVTVHAQDPDHAGQLALLEAMKRMD